MFGVYRIGVMKLADGDNTIAIKNGSGLTPSIRADSMRNGNSSTATASFRWRPVGHLSKASMLLGDGLANRRCRS